MASKTAFISERYFWMCFINLHTTPCSSHFKRVKAYCQMHCEDSTGKQ